MDYEVDISALAPNKIETYAILKKLTVTRAALAELKGVAATIPNEHILIDTLSLQEAKDSSAIENIVTTHDELYRNVGRRRHFSTANAKEVYSYAGALKRGAAHVRREGNISMRLIIELQAMIEGNDAGLRKVPGTVLRNDRTNEVIYEPPQDGAEIKRLMNALERFIHSEDETDPLVRMAVIHHHFESIHPFYDGNGRTGRILNILYLIKEGLLELPILYLSRYIIAHRAQYYRLLQSTRSSGEWEGWVLYMLDAVLHTSKETVVVIKDIKSLMLKTKKKIRSEAPRVYSQDLINNIFRHPYTKMDVFMEDLQVSRPTARKYLQVLVDLQLLEIKKEGRSNYFINTALLELLRSPFSE